MTVKRDYYRTLYVDRDAPQEVIQMSYRTLMSRLRMHPDFGGDPVEAAHVNTAFETLSDPLRRAVYDASLCPKESDKGGKARCAERASLQAEYRCSFCGAPCGRHIVIRPETTCVECGSPLAPPDRRGGGGDVRRAAPRLQRELPVTFRRAASRDTAQKGITKDVSLNGLRLLSPVELAVGERLAIDSGFCSATVEVKSIRWNASGSGPGWECGVQFLTLRLAHQRGGLFSTVA